MASLSTEEFVGFLARLDPDRTRAAEKYLILRHKVVKVLEWTQCGDPEVLADEAMDRIAKKLKQDVIYNLNSFAFGVAQKISLEIHRDAARLVSIQDHYESDDSLIGDPDPETRILESMRNANDIRCLNECLRRLPPGASELLLEYYRGEKQARIQCRQNLARQRGISLAALRREMNILREKVKGCIHRCLKKNSKGKPSG